MKRILSSLALFSILGFLALPLATSGQTGLPVRIEEAPTKELFEMLQTITNLLFTLLLVAAGIAIIIAAFYFVTAAGDPERVKTARQFVIYALIGVVVAIAAIGLVRGIERVLR